MKDEVHEIQKILGYVSCTLSVFGSILVMSSYLFFPELRRPGRRLLLFLSVSDLGTSVSYLISLTFCNTKDLGKRGSVAAWPEVQAYLGIYFPVTTFIWTDCIALYLWSSLKHHKWVRNIKHYPSQNINKPNQNISPNTKTKSNYTNTDTHPNTNTNKNKNMLKKQLTYKNELNKTKKIFRWFHLISWLLPIFGCILPLIILDQKYGNVFEVPDDTTGGWCWVNHWYYQLIGGKFIEFLTIIFILFCYCQSWYVLRFVHIPKKSTDYRIQHKPKQSIIKKRHSKFISTSPKSTPYSNPNPRVHNIGNTQQLSRSHVQQQTNYLVVPTKNIENSPDSPDSDNDIVENIHKSVVNVPGIPQYSVITEDNSSCRGSHSNSSEPSQILRESDTNFLPIQEHTTKTIGPTIKNNDNDNLGNPGDLWKDDNIHIKINKKSINNDMDNDSDNDSEKNDKITTIETRNLNAMDDFAYESLTHTPTLGLSVQHQDNINKTTPISPITPITPMSPNSPNSPIVPITTAPIEVDLRSGLNKTFPKIKHSTMDNIDNYNNKNINNIKRIPKWKTTVTSVNRSMNLNPRISIKLNDSKTNENLKSKSHKKIKNPRKQYDRLILVPLSFFIVRLFGNVRVMIQGYCQFQYSTRGLNYCDSKYLQTPNDILGYGQAFFDPAQGWVNCLLFVFLTKAVRDIMLYKMNEYIKNLNSILFFQFICDYLFCCRFLCCFHCSKRRVSPNTITNKNQYNQTNSTNKNIEKKQLNNNNDKIKETTKENENQSIESENGNPNKPHTQSIIGDSDLTQDALISSFGTSNDYCCYDKEKNEICWYYCCYKPFHCIINICKICWSDCDCFCYCCNNNTCCCYNKERLNRVRSLGKFTHYQYGTQPKMYSKSKYPNGYANMDHLQNIRSKTQKQAIVHSQQQQQQQQQHLQRQYQQNQHQLHQQAVYGTHPFNNAYGTNQRQFTRKQTPYRTHSG